MEITIINIYWIILSKIITLLREIIIIVILIMDKRLGRDIVWKNKELEKIKYSSCRDR